MAYVNIIVQVVVAIVAAIVSSYMALDRIPDAKAQTGRTPESTDGTSIRKIYGVVWIDDSQVLAWKDLPPEPIKTKVGK